MMPLHFRLEFAHFYAVHRAAQLSSFREIKARFPAKSCRVLVVFSDPIFGRYSSQFECDK